MNNEKGKFNNICNGRANLEDFCESEANLFSSKIDRTFIEG